MNKNFYIVIAIVMALFVGVLVGVSVGINMKSTYINTGDSYEYYNQEDLDPGMKLNPWDS